MNFLCNLSEPRASLSDATTFTFAHVLISCSNSAANVLLAVGVPSLRQCSTGNNNDDNVSEDASSVS